MKIISMWLIIGILFIATLSGCAKGQGGSTPTAVSDIESYKPMINATGVVVPSQWAVLSAQTTGVVGQVLVIDGESVTSGQLLMQLEGTETAKARVAATKLELADAQQSYDNLIKDAASLAAKSQSDIVKANEMILSAERALDDLEQNPYLDDVKQARKDVEREKVQLEVSQKNFDKYSSRPETDATRKYFADKLADQLRDYDAAVRDLQELEMQKNQAEADLASGKALLATAQGDYDMRKDGPAHADMLVVEARLDNAKAQLESTQTALDQISLIAPFAGTASNPKVRAGELVSVGQPLVYLADLGTLQVETTDLNEIDVARLDIGDRALVTFDALPDVSAIGKVSRIASKSSEGSGVNYTVVVTLDQVPDKLLWGMTAFVDIEVKK